MTTPLPPELQTQTTSGANNISHSPTTTSVPQTITVPQQQYFTAEQLEAARQQEKDKLYDKMRQQEERLNQFQTDMQKWQDEKKAAEDAAEQARQAEAEATRLAEEEKLSVTELLKRKDEEWTNRQTEMEKKMEVERAIMAKDRELFQLQNYIQRRVAEEMAANTIIPDLVDFIDGNTPEEVETSITRLKEKTASIVEGRNRMISGQPSTPGVSPTGFAPTGPLDNLTGTQEVTPDQIKAMSNAEFAKFRAQVGIDKAGNNKGLFG